MANPCQLPLERLISGGQTGVDRGALDAAIAANLAHGGWCPNGRIAEDGAIPMTYRLVETDSADYPVRTEKNVVDSDATLILYRNQLAGGTKLTYQLTKKHGRPAHLHDLAHSSDVGPTRRWIFDNQVRVLNVAGPRESSAPGIQQEAYDFVLRLLSGADP